ncbi:LOW QUALITY PROTEIN: O(6)-methylguanine-induced apoptosis 2 [Tyto alba]|uniref:LOW QUALITY PROTEIN: O(6)-methylguanine-induced apoptosis 2 n=1 Tax=Tyto alba TaxID=56313 RepID=UPI001C67C9FC|nr:LOW QUALITY PROTEIN: O(6)-methylguanine-induced apoptosis 2 [Tyto alba]
MTELLSVQRSFQYNCSPRTHLLPQGATLALRPRRSAPEAGPLAPSFGSRPRAAFGSCPAPPICCQPCQQSGAGPGTGCQARVGPGPAYGPSPPEAQRSEEAGGRIRVPRRGNETPGPGFCSVTHQSAEINSTSLSKKGTEYFPSLPKQDFKKRNCSIFPQPIPRKMEKIPTPAPNQYYVTRFAKENKGITADTSMDFCKQSNNISGQAAFMSKTMRGLNLEKFGKWPSACHYSINDSLIRVSPKGITSCFKAKTSCLTRLCRFTPEPATYQPHKPTKEAKKMPFRNSAGLFLLQTIPPCKDPPLPGQYDLVDDKGCPKRDCSSAVFVSNTGQWAERTSQEGFPGTGACSPGALRKYSLVCSYSRKRLPALGAAEPGHQSRDPQTGLPSASR